MSLWGIAKCREIARLTQEKISILTALPEAPARRPSVAPLTSAIARGRDDRHPL